MHRSEVQLTYTVEEEVDGIWRQQQEPQQEARPPASEPVTMRHPECAAECRLEALVRRWSARPASLSSASSSDSGVRGDLSDASGSRLVFTAAASADSGCAAWDELDERDWDSCSDASGEYEPLRQPATGPPHYCRSLTLPPPPPPTPPPPPPRPPPGTLPRRKDLTRHLGMPQELGGSLAELRAGSSATANRKDLALFLGMAEPAPPPRTGLWRRWTSKRGAQPEPAAAQPGNNGSLPDLARLRVGGESASEPATPRRRRAAASPRLLGSALRRVQERALRAVARSGTAEVAGPGDGEPTLVFQAKRGSFEAPSVLVSGERWPGPHRAPPAPPGGSGGGGGMRKLRLPTPPPEPPSRPPLAAPAGPPTDRLPPPPPETPPPSEPAPAAADDSAYMTMEAIRALSRAPPPPPVPPVPLSASRLTPEQEDDSGYLSMDAVRQLMRAGRAASPVRPRLGSDYANLADLSSALRGLRLTTAEDS